MVQPARDYRYVGPVLECPVCQCTWFNACVAFDPETNLIGAWVTNGSCIQCESLVTLPTPLDEIRRETPDEDEPSDAGLA